MKASKSLAALFAAAVLAGAMAVPALADETTVPVTYQVPSTYTLKIPDEIEAKNTKFAEYISTTTRNIANGQQLIVTVSGDDLFGGGEGDFIATIYGLKLYRKGDTKGQEKIVQVPLYHLNLEELKRTLAEDGLKLPESTFVIAAFRGTEDSQSIGGGIEIDVPVNYDGTPTIEAGTYTNTMIFTASMLGTPPTPTAPPAA